MGKNQYNQIPLVCYDDEGNKEILGYGKVYVEDNKVMFESQITNEEVKKLFSGGNKVSGISIDPNDFTFEKKET